MRIIIVEDEPNTREGIMNMIRRYTDHQVAAVAENGEEGLEMIEKYRPHLVITDVRMPKMNGLDMLEEVKKRPIDVQAVVLTGYSEFEYARQALRLGVTEYVLNRWSWTISCQRWNRQRPGWNRKRRSGCCRSRCSGRISAETERNGQVCIPC